MSNKRKSLRTVRETKAAAYYESSDSSDEVPVDDSDHIGPSICDAIVDIDHIEPILCDNKAIDGEVHVQGNQSSVSLQDDLLWNEINSHFIKEMFDNTDSDEDGADLQLKLELQTWAVESGVS